MKKRHVSLIPLSHHHHHGLVVALKLQNARLENGRWSIEEIRKDAKAFWENGGNDHFREEEEVLFPAFSMFCDIEKVPEIAQALLEHVKIRAMFRQLIDGKVKNEIDFMHELGHLFNHHIRMEERIIFPLIEEEVPDDILREIGVHFDAHEEVYS